MAENEPLTPEKQLLKLIENPKQETLRAANAKREGKKRFSFSALTGKFGLWKSLPKDKWFSFKRIPKSSFGLRQINVIITFCIVMFGAYAVYGFGKMGLELQKVSNLNLSAGESASVEMREQAEGVKDLLYYVDKIVPRNIFSAVKVQETVKSEDGEETVVVPEGEEKVDRSKDFRLVGIAWSSNPEAMIEDTKSKRTYFVRRGQRIDPEVKVLSVLKDRVILRAGDKEFEL